MARDATPAYTDDLSLLTDLEVYELFEDETDPVRKQLLSNECKLRAQIYCAVQEVN